MDTGQVRIDNYTNGFTLIELLVVVSIIAILSLAGYVNFKTFSANQVAIKAAGQIQSYLRLTQTSATTSTICGTNQPSINWHLGFQADQKTVIINCFYGLYPNYNTIKTLILTNAIFKITGSGLGCPPAPNSYLSLVYDSGSGRPQFYDASDPNPDTDPPLPCTGWTITVSNSSDTSAPTSSFSINNGGAINVL